MVISLQTIVLIHAHILHILEILERDNVLKIAQKGHMLMSISTDSANLNVLKIHQPLLKILQINV